MKNKNTALAEQEQVQEQSPVQEPAQEQEQEQATEVQLFTVEQFLKDSWVSTYKPENIVVVDTEGSQIDPQTLDTMLLTHYLHITHLQPLQSLLTSQNSNLANRMQAELLTLVNKIDSYKAEVQKHLTKLQKIKSTIWMLHQDDNKDIAELTAHTYNLDYKQVIEEMQATINTNTINTNTTSNNSDSSKKLLEVYVGGNKVTGKPIRLNAYEVATKLVANKALPAGSKGSAVAEAGIDISQLTEINQAIEATINGLQVKVVRVQ